MTSRTTRKQCLACSSVAVNLRWKERFANLTDFKCVPPQGSLSVLSISSTFPLAQKVAGRKARLDSRYITATKTNSIKQSIKRPMSQFFLHPGWTPASGDRAASPMAPAALPMPTTDRPFAGSVSQASNPRYVEDCRMNWLRIFVSKRLGHWLLPLVDGKVGSYLFIGIIGWVE